MDTSFIGDRMGPRSVSALNWFLIGVGYMADTRVGGWFIDRFLSFRVGH